MNDAVVPQFSGTSPLQRSLRHSPEGMNFGNVYAGSHQPLMPGEGLVKSLARGWLQNLFGNEVKQYAAQPPPVSRFSNVSNFADAASNTYRMMSNFRPVPGLLDQMESFSPQLAPTAEILRSVSGDPYVINQLQNSFMRPVVPYMR